MQILKDIGSYAGIGAVVGLAVLSALYFSQARDVKRLREWAGRAPERTSEGTAAQQIAPQRVTAVPQAKPAAAAGKQAAAPAAAQQGAAKPAAAAAAGAATPQARPAAATPAAQGKHSETEHRQPPVTAQAKPATGDDKATDEKKPVAAEAKDSEATEKKHSETEHREPAAAEAKHSETEHRQPVPAEAKEPAAAGAKHSETEHRQPAAVGAAAAGGAAAASGEAKTAQPSAGGGTAAPVKPGDGAGTGDGPPAPAPGTPAAPTPPAKPAAATPAGTRPVPKEPPPVPRTPPPKRPIPSLPSRPGETPSPGPSQTAILPPYGQEPMPWYRRLLASPRHLVLAIVGVLIVGGAAAFGLSELSKKEAPPPRHQQAPASDTPNKTTKHKKAAPINARNVTVSVLNGTTVPGLAAQIGDRVGALGFQLGNVTNSSDQQRAESVVLFAPGAQREAAFVGRKLGIAQREPIDPQSQTLAGDARVVVITGADKTR
jgi:LytR cell envelope-related transcriptional attenuator